MVDAPREHAILSASSAYRWISCPPSAMLEEKEPESTSVYAEEGTLAHEVAANKLENALASKGTPIRSDVDAEMEECTTEYVNYILSLIKGGNETVFFTGVEQKVSFVKWVPLGFGTADFVAVIGKTVHVVDFKYGKGVTVSAIDNPQMRLYALGTMEGLRGILDFDTITTHIFQPRVNNISCESLPIKELLAYAKKVISPKAALAIKGKGDFKAGEHCRFCKIQHKCKALAKSNLEIAKYKFADPLTLSLAEISEIMTKAKDFEVWIKSVEAYALSEALAGTPIPNMKLVEGRGKRVYTDPDAILTALLNSGYDEALLYKPKEMLTISNMEKVVGKKKFTEVAGAYVYKQAGAPTLVPDTDNRRTYNTAEQVFKKE